MHNPGSHRVSVGCQLRAAPPALRRVVLLVALVTGWLPVSCTEKGHAASGPPQTPPVPVSVATVGRQTVPDEVHVIGNVETKANVAMKAQVGGPLTEVHVADGQVLQKDDLLFVIDPRPFDIALRQAEAQLARDKAQAEDARADYDRLKNLLERSSSTPREVDHAVAVADSADAAVRADQAMVDGARLNLQYCTIHSPLDGVAGSVQLHVGDMVKANDVPILVWINQIEPINVAFAVPERYLTKVRDRMKEGVLPVTVTVDGDPRPPAEGRLFFLDNQVDQSSGTFRLKAQFANQDHRLWPGQFVHVVLTLGEHADAAVVPSQAVQVGQQGSYVFVVKVQDQTVEMRPITTGVVRGGQTVVEKGLSPGETVVTDGQLNLIPGAKVTVQSARESAATQPESEARR
jgi:membrane fusion protein, multidrug efflux system